MSFNPPTAAKSSHNFLSEQAEQPTAEAPGTRQGHPSMPIIPLYIFGGANSAPAEGQGAKWHLREKGAVPDNYWQKSTEDGYSMSGSKALPNKL